MKNLSVLCLIALTTLTTLTSVVSAAPNAKGDKARTIIRALKYAGVKPTHVKQSWTFKATSLTCHSADEGADDGLGEVDCTIDKLEIKDGLADSLMNALVTGGMSTDDGAGQSHVRASTLVCVDDQGAKGGADAMYTCSWK